MSDCRFGVSPVNYPDPDPALPDSPISSAEDAEDCVAKFPSLVRARD